MTIKACLSTGKDDWETPDDLFQRYNARYHFVLDAAATAENTKCENYFSPTGDALSADWQPWLALGNIWLNPPYSAGNQARFVKRACEEALIGEMWDHAIVCLLPARTDTRLFHETIWAMGDVEFLKGRVKFKGAAQGAPFPSMIVTFGLVQDNDRRLEELGNGIGVNPVTHLG